MKRHLTLLATLLPLLAHAGFGGMDKVDYDGEATASGGGVFFILLGAAAGFVWAEFKRYQSWVGIAIGAVAGLVVQLILGA